MKMNLNYAALLLQLSLVTIILLKFFVCGQSHKMETKKPNASSSPHLLLRRRVKRIGVPALIAMFGPPPPAFNQGSSASASAASAAGSAASNVPAYNAPPQPPQFSQQQGIQSQQPFIGPQQGSQQGFQGPQASEQFQGPQQGPQQFQGPQQGPQQFQAPQQAPQQFQGPQQGPQQFQAPQQAPQQFPPAQAPEQPPPEPVSPNQQFPLANQPLEPVSPEPMPATTNLPPVQPRKPYPLPECYTDRTENMCCNNHLEDLMTQEIQSVFNSVPDFNSCNINKIANAVQKAAEQRFNRTFDVIVGIGDYFSKSHFNVDHICKVTMHDRYVLAYETVPRGQALKFNGTLSELDPRLYGGQTTGTGNSSRTSPPAAAAELGFRRKRSSKGMC